MTALLVLLGAVGVALVISGLRSLLALRRDERTRRSFIGAHQATVRARQIERLR